MRDLGRRSATHKAVVNEVAFVGPSRDLVLYELFRKDRRMLEGDLVFRARRAYIVIEDLGVTVIKDIIDLALFRSPSDEPWPKSSRVQAR